MINLPIKILNLCMIVQSTYTMRFPLRGVIQHVFPAFNHTFVLLYRYFISQNKCILHIDWKGEIIEKYSLEKGIQPIFRMFNNHQLLYADPNDGTISRIDFQTKKTGFLWNRFPGKRILGMEFFIKTNLLLIVAQDQDVKDAKIHLIYMNPQSWCFLDQFSQPIPDSVGYNFHQGNSRSMMIWCKRFPESGREGKYLDFFTKSLNQKVVRFCIKMPPEFYQFQLQRIWQAQKGRFMLACPIAFNNPTYATRNFLTFDSRSGVLSYIRVSSISSIYELIRFDNLSVLLDWNPEVNKGAEVSVLHNPSLSVISQMNFNYNGIQKLYAIDYESDCFLLTNEEQYVTLSIKLYRFCFARKDHYMHLMLELAKELDDDLLQEALTLLQQI